MAGRCFKTSHPTSISGFQPDFLADSIFPKICWPPAFGRRLQTIWLRKVWLSPKNDMSYSDLEKKINNTKKRNGKCYSNRWSFLIAKIRITNGHWRGICNHRGIKVVRCCKIFVTDSIKIDLLKLDFLWLTPKFFINDAIATHIWPWLTLNQPLLNSF